MADLAAEWKEVSDEKTDKNWFCTPLTTRSWSSPALALVAQFKDNQIQVEMIILTTHKLD